MPRRLRSRVIVPSSSESDEDNQIQETESSQDLFFIPPSPELLRRVHTNSAYGPASQDVIPDSSDELEIPDFGFGDLYSWIDHNHHNEVDAASASLFSEPPPSQVNREASPSLFGHPPPSQVIGAGASTQADWSWTRDSPSTPAPEFDESLSGWNVHFDMDTTELELFDLVFTDDAKEFCIDQTNKFAEGHIQAKTTTKRNHQGQQLTRRQKKWVPMNDSDFMRFLAVRIVMGYNIKPEQEDYWSQDALRGCKVVPQIMNSDRYFELHQHLHLCDNEDVTNEADRLHKITKLWQMCNDRFGEIRIPGRKLAVDESLVLFKGRLFWKQFIPSKRSRFGIKIFALVDEETGFILCVRVYTGKGKDELVHDIKQFGYGGGILLELVEPYIYANRCVFADNYFTSPNLAYFLLQHSTFICGTLRANRKHIPKLDPHEKLRHGDARVFVCHMPEGDITVEFWRDRKQVRMISTGMEHEMSLTVSKAGTAKEKPYSVLMYNKNARGIDLADMNMQFYELTKKTNKWYKKLFFRMMDTCIFNAFCMWKTFHPGTPFLQFRLNLLRQILFKYGGVTANQKVQQLSPLRLTERHFIGTTNSKHNGKHSRQRCYVCSHGIQKKETRTIYICKQCNVPLCLEPCFEIYHTHKNF